jgi:hypothetical protein
LISYRRQPRKGIISSDFLSTKTSGGKIAWRLTVSHADWCLARITDGVDGMFSRPMTW